MKRARQDSPPISFSSTGHLSDQIVGLVIAGETAMKMVQLADDHYVCLEAANNDCDPFCLSDNMLWRLSRCPNMKCREVFTIKETVFYEYANNMWPVTALFSCPSCPYTTRKFMECKKHIIKHIIIKSTDNDPPVPQTPLDGDN